jgi:hypothetical protein
MTTTNKQNNFLRKLGLTVVTIPSGGYEVRDGGKTVRVYKTRSAAWKHVRKELSLPRQSEASKKAFDYLQSFVK